VNIFGAATSEAAMQPDPLVTVRTMRMLTVPRSSRSASGRLIVDTPCAAHPPGHADARRRSAAGRRGSTGAGGTGGREMIGDTMRLGITGPRFGSLNGKCYSFLGWRSGKLQTHRTRGGSLTHRGELARPRLLGTEHREVHREAGEPNLGFGRIAASGTAALNLSVILA
jgi:hypothetical protein